MKTKSKTVAFILALCILFCGLPAAHAYAADSGESAVAASGRAGANAVWQLTENGVLTVSGTGAVYDDFVPGDAYLSAHTTDIYEIVIKEGITAIGFSAFYECVSAVSVSLPNSLEKLGSCAFGFCLSLQSVTIPDKITVLPADLFFSDYSIVEVKLPKNLKRIEWQALLCSGLHIIRIPASVEKIEAAAFYAAGIEYVLFEGTKQQWQKVVDFEHNDCLKTAKVFYEYTEAKPVVLEEGECGADGTNMKWTITSDNTLTISGSGEMKDFYGEEGAFPCHPWCRLKAYDFVKTIVVKEGVKSISAYAFYGTKAEKVILANSLTYVPGSAFVWNDTIREINIPDRLDRYCYTICSELSALETVTATSACINFYVDASGALFSKTDNMLIKAPGKCTEVHIPKDVEEVLSDAFQYNTAILSVTVDPDNPVFSSEQGVLFRREGDHPLYTLVYCPSAIPLSTYQCPEQTVQIESYAFADNQTLKKIVLTDAVKGIGMSAFERCRAEEIVLPEQVESMGSVCFQDCYYLRSVNLPCGAESTYFMFNHCISLESVSLPDTINAIEEVAFGECWSLKEITLPDGIRSIDSCAFRGCGCITSIVFPASLERIDREAFWRCDSLEYAVFLNDTVELDYNAFNYSILGDPDSGWYAAGPDNLTFVCGSGSTAVQYAENMRLKTMPLNVNGHIYIPDVSVPPTCTLPGKTEGAHCLECGEILKEQTEIPAAGHKWGYGIITKAPTETETGIRTFTCEVCGETKTETIDVIYNGPGTPEVQPYSGGDPDGDGRITAADARLALRKSVGLENFAEGSPAFVACDVDHDAKVTAADARLILRASVGMEDPKKL